MADHSTQQQVISSSSSSTAAAAATASETVNQVPSTSTSSYKKRPRNAKGVEPKKRGRNKRTKYVFDEAPSSAREEEDELRYTVIREVGQRVSYRFQYFEKMYVLALKEEIAENPPPDWDWMTAAINGMWKYAKRRMQFQQGDKINIIVENRNFNNPVSTGYGWTGDTAAKLVNKIRDIITSDTNVRLKDCIFRVSVVKIPRGRGRTKILNLADDKCTKRCIIQIKNADNLCCPRAIITGLVVITDEIMDQTLTAEERVTVRKGSGRLQKKLAEKLCERAGIPSTKEEFTIEDIKKFEDVLNIQVKVISAENFNSVSYKGAEQKPTLVMLYQNRNHFDVITKMNAFFGSCYYCNQCDTPYNNKDAHDCKKIRKVDQSKLCQLCTNEKHESNTADPVYCDNCNRYCYNAACMADHLQKICPTVTRCISRCKVMNRMDVPKHHCGWGYCRNCHKPVEFDKHMCYMQRKTAKGRRCGNTNCPKCGDDPQWYDDKGRLVNADKCTYTEKYIFFDYEAQQETGIHIPNLVVAHDFEGNKYQFPNNDEFCKWLISRDHRDYTAIAHYARGYDSQFILQYMIANCILPKIVSSGTKLMLVEVPHLRLRIIDSHNFLQTSLSALPKMFGLTELKKGYFPHLFNTAENEGYVGPMPPVECYSPDNMKTEARAAFLQWYQERVAENYVFDLNRELFEYCESDVDILRRACLELRKEFLEVANIDPFRYLTTPSVCMGIYRSKYLPNNTVAVLPNEQDHYSKQAMAWLYSLENDRIRHALNGGEVHKCGGPVDGYDEETRTVYQFHGCYWHGCPLCFEEDLMNTAKKETMRDLYLKTVHRTEDLRRAGYTVVEMWGCAWKKTPARSQWEKKCENLMVVPLNPRNAFYGGRTEVFQLKATGGPQMSSEQPLPLEQSDQMQVDDLILLYILLILYADVCSLYPSAMFFDWYPIGHPIKLYRPKLYNPAWFGVIYCRILPPQQLYVPVLPVRVKVNGDEKLLFPLCYTCAANKCQTCNHNNKQRALTGTWPTIEVDEALRRGYRILEIYEVWNFTRSCDLWRGYVRDFMKLKLESSPHNYPTDEAYVEEIQNKLGITLDRTQIASNPGKRALAKLCLNSLWGKFGQRSNLATDEFVTEPWRFYEILMDDTLVDINVFYVSEQMMHVSYRKKDHFIEDKTSTNIMVAVYTTANARLRLYEKLVKIDRNLLYCDTDSVIYKLREGDENPIQFGEMLGEWTNELSGDDYITKWLATGPKSYHFQTRDGKKVTKVKGFTLHHRNLQEIKAETMEKLIDGDIPSVTTRDFQIIRDKNTKQLVTKKEVCKTLKFNFDKRVIVDDYDTLPYGYRL